MTEELQDLSVLCEIELTYKARRKGTVKLTDSRSVFEFLKEIWSDDMEVRESFYCVYLTNYNQVLGYLEVCKGGCSSTLVDAKLVFAPALKMLACNVIVAHNHPSGRVNPSQSDLDITERLFQAAKALDIRLIDHVIMATENNYYSFSDEGKLN